MNRKSILSLLGAITVVAAAYLLGVMTREASPPAQAPVSRKAPASTRPSPAPVAVAPSVTPASDVASKPAPAPPASSVAAETALPDPESFVKSLTDEQNKNLCHLLGEKQPNMFHDVERYQLVADQDLMRLDRDPNLAVTEAQKQKLADLKAVYRTKIDAALGDKFTQLDELDRKIVELGKQPEAKLATGTYWSAQETLRQRYELVGKIQEAKALFEADYELSVRACLNYAQTQAFDEYKAQTARTLAIFRQMDNQSNALQKLNAIQAQP